MFPIFTKISIFLFQNTALHLKDVVWNVEECVDTQTPVTGPVARGTTAPGSKRPIRMKPPEKENGLSLQYWA